MSGSVRAPAHQSGAHKQQLGAGICKFIQWISAGYPLDIRFVEKSKRMNPVYSPERYPPDISRIFAGWIHKYWPLNGAGFSAPKP